MIRLLFGRDNRLLKTFAHRDARACRGSLVSYPEARLHPRDQLHAAQALIDRALAGEELVVVTHSQAVMARVKRRVEEGVLPAAQVEVAWVGRNMYSGEPYRYVLRLDAEGDFIDEWPEGYFHETFYELFGWPCGKEP